MASYDGGQRSAKATRGGWVSNNSSGRADLRVQRTRWALAQALMQLAPQDGLDALEIAKLTAAAGVARSTFYKHFAYKDDFLVTSFGSVIRQFDAVAAGRGGYDCMLPAREVFAHVEQARDFALALVASGHFERTQGARELKVRAVASANLARLRPELPSARREELSVLLAGLFMCLLRWWTDQALHQSAAHVASLYETAARRLLQAGG